ncbi:MAG: hypothetical protein WEB58_12885 [Planctomycetaceae bacterium]
MTPQIIRARLLRARLDAVKDIAEEVKLLCPRLDNVAELTDVLNEERAAIQTAILAIQAERQAAGTLSGRPAGGV